MLHLLPSNGKKASSYQQAQHLAKLLLLLRRESLPQLLRENRHRRFRQRRGVTHLLMLSDMEHLLVVQIGELGTTAPVVTTPIN